MKILVVMRHGDYCGLDDHLSDHGQYQITQISDQLKTHYLNGGTARILTSTAKRAVQSAAIVSQAVGAFVEEYDLLWSECGRKEDLPGALELVQRRGSDVDLLILCTHFEYVNRFPSFFGLKELGVNLHHDRVEKGQALIVDCVDRVILAHLPERIITF